MNIFSNIVLFTLVFGSLIGATPVDAGTQQISDTNIEQYSVDTGYSDNLYNVEDTNIKERVTKINNEINNMLAGKVSPADAHDDIYDEKFFAKERGKV